MAIFKVDHKSSKVSFLLNATFTAVSFALIFIFNDFVDWGLEKIDHETHIKASLKVVIHFASILVFSIVLSYIFRFLFGWKIAPAP